MQDCRLNPFVSSTAAAQLSAILLKAFLSPPLLLGVPCKRIQASKLCSTADSAVHHTESYKSSSYLLTSWMLRCYGWPNTSNSSALPQPRRELFSSCFSFCLLKLSGHLSPHPGLCLAPRSAPLCSAADSQLLSLPFFCYWLSWRYEVSCYMCAREGGRAARGATASWASRWCELPGAPKRQHLLLASPVHLLLAKSFLFFLLITAFSGVGHELILSLW